ncbi:hypothetical protein K4L44_16945 [Halosquirtibacter laminarini]|uniref:Uncharacterized protein n=1 Tax=Halosquirtibacter laminarini TaxID=3374600 RepID=A0AC61NF07_9BACT|nr:hypothetical protein K4L44_16945 [Prolixibacteraceae bacterium]
MIKIYHNPRCKKSREGLEYLKSKNVDIQIVEYLKEGLTIEMLQGLLTRFDGSVEDLLRKQEKYYKDNLKNSDMSEKKILQEIIKEPRLLQRPIIDNGASVVIGNPVDVIDLLM